MRTCVKSVSGFTLLEIMISISIIGGLLVTLLYTLNHHLDVAGRHETITVSAMLAKAKIDEMEKKPAQTTGSFDPPYESYSFETGIRDSRFPGMSEIWVKVRKDREITAFSELILGTK